MGLRNNDDEAGGLWDRKTCDQEISRCLKVYPKPRVDNSGRFGSTFDLNAFQAL